MLAAHAHAQSPKPPPYPPPGRLVDIGGYRVHLYCSGEGNPAVIVVGAGFSFDWALVQPEVAKFTRICTYDPSGTAWSDPGPPLTCASRVNEIHQVLQTAEVKGPYVLVGLSAGALVTRLYASLYPDAVAGVVMVDHAFIDVRSAPAPEAGNSGSNRPVLLQQTPMTFTAEDSSQFRNLPERSRQLHRWAASLQPVLPTVETAKDCLAQLKSTEKAPHPLGNKPLVVISTGNRQPNYKKLQEELLGLSQQSEQMMAAASFHSVEIDEPDVVITGIGVVVDKVRQPR